MKLWQRAAGALKDQNSIWAATLSRNSSYRNPNLESAIIKATSHDELHVDYRNAHRVFAWIRTTPSCLMPFLWTLSRRMQKTRSWVVSLKGLILMHGVLCCKIPAVQNIGRLPFDLSGFRHGHARPGSWWGFDDFIHAYYAFLDHRSSFLFEQRSKRNEPEPEPEPEPPPLVREILKLQKWQSLLDLLLQIKPQSKDMRVVLILEAMDCLVIEIFDVYGRICSGVARVLLGIYSAEKPEVEMALEVLQKATQQGEEISLYFKFCREFGVTNTMGIPKAYQIPVQDIEDLKRFVEGFSQENEEEEEDTESGGFSDIKVAAEENAMVPVTDQDEDRLNNKALMTTIITDKWEVFDHQGNEGINNNNNHNPFLDSTSILPLVSYQNDLPDLICF